jgi:putative radical SAM enzyme (TIGR03279 family)
MSVLIKSVAPDSPAARAGIKAGSRLVSIDGQRINDVLDFMFYGDDDMGLEFDTYLMDNKRSCGNNCIFCFIDQNPPGMRESVYFKDDDSRLSFLQGNYITLTNLTEADVERIIKMRTPVNVSVHTTNPDLRAKMMGNPRAGQSLTVLSRFARANIPMNCQLVLCPGINDGAELLRSLGELSQYNSIESVAVVPVGLTKHRTALAELRTFTKSEAADVIKTVGGYGNVYAADEFYLIAEMEVPAYDYYGSFPQYENGVGMLAYMCRGFKPPKSYKMTAIITGTAAEPTLKRLTERLGRVDVFAVRNDFFGETITVSGLIAGQDIISQLSVHSMDRYEQILISANSLNADGLFIDDTTPEQIESALAVKVKIVQPDGESLYNALISRTDS